MVAVAVRIVVAFILGVFLFASPLARAEEEVVGAGHAPREEEAVEAAATPDLKDVPPATTVKISDDLKVVRTAFEKILQSKTTTEKQQLLESVFKAPEKVSELLTERATSMLKRVPENLLTEDERKNLQDAIEKPGKDKFSAFDFWQATSPLIPGEKEYAPLTSKVDSTVAKVEKILNLVNGSDKPKPAAPTAAAAAKKEESKTADNSEKKDAKPIDLSKLREEVLAEVRKASDAQRRSKDDLEEKLVEALKRDGKGRGGSDDDGEGRGRDGEDGDERGERRNLRGENNRGGNFQPPPPPPSGGGEGRESSRGDFHVPEREGNGNGREQNNNGNGGNSNAAFAAFGRNRGGSDEDSQDKKSDDRKSSDSSSSSSKLKPEDIFGDLDKENSDEKKTPTKDSTKDLLSSLNAAGLGNEDNKTLPPPSDRPPFNGTVGELAPPPVSAAASSGAGGAGGAGAPAIPKGGGSSGGGGMSGGGDASAAADPMLFNVGGGMGYAVGRGIGYQFERPIEYGAAASGSSSFSSDAGGPEGGEAVTKAKATALAQTVRMMTGSFSNDSGHGIFSVARSNDPCGTGLAPFIGVCQRIREGKATAIPTVGDKGI